MNWNKSYSSQWKVYRVNRQTWADKEEIQNIDAVDITKTADGDLLESGSMEISGEFESDYYRIALIAEQDGQVERVDVATLLFDVASGKINRGITVPTADGYSVLYPASVAKMITGDYAPKGINGAEYAGEILKETLNAPVRVEGSFTLNDNIVHEIGDSVLEAAWSVLDAGGFVIQIDGRGTVHIKKKPIDISLQIDTSNARLLLPEISYSNDMSDIPNRYIVVSGANITTVVNDDPESPVSSVNRGYYVDEVDESPEPVNGETLGQYAKRKLEELSVLNDERDYTREYAPDVYIYSMVRASLDGLEGDLRVQEQGINCKNGITINEKAVREVKLWTE